MSFLKEVSEEEFDKEFNNRKKECRKGKKTSLFHKHIFDNRYYALIWAVVIKTKYGEATIFKYMPTVLHCVVCDKKWLKWVGYKN